MCPTVKSSLSLVLDLALNLSNWIEFKIDILDVIIAVRLGLGWAGSLNES